MVANKTQLKQRFDYWEDHRGSYILGQRYRDELRELLFTGKTEGLDYTEEKQRNTKDGK